MNRIDNYRLDKQPFQFIYHYRSETDFGIFHAHQGLEFLYVHEGSGHVFVNREKVPVRSGTLLIFQPFQLHRIHMDVVGGTPYVRTFFILEPVAMLPFLHAFPQQKSFLEHLWKGDIPFRKLENLQEEPSIAMMLRELDCQLRSGKPPEPATFAPAALLLLQTVERLWRAAATGREASPSKPARRAGISEQIMDWLETHYREPFRLQRLADELHLAGNYLSTVFTRETGGSITEYVTARRLREACFLLTTTSDSVREIAERIGLTNVSYFCQLFKKRFGLSPHQYRKRITET